MVDSPLILSIETATLTGSVAMCKGDEVVAVHNGHDGPSHSNTLLRTIESVLKDNGIQLSDIDLFAVAIGPGSFTGLRIGLATVKGLAFTLERPCIGIPTLEAVAHSAGTCEHVVAALPAGRGEVIAQMFRVSSDTVAAIDEATHISPSQVLEKYSTFKQVCWCGEGANLHRDRIREWAESNGHVFASEASATADSWRVVSTSSSLATNVAILALRKVRMNDVSSAEDLSAMYVRPSDAELKTRSVG
jgi:tRNA threonylcarbamoyladenosine biosynthesis protein TsaB